MKLAELGITIAIVWEGKKGFFFLFLFLFLFSKREISHWCSREYGPTLRQMVIGEEEVKRKRKRKRKRERRSRGRTHTMAIFLEAGLAELLLKLGM